MRRIGPVVTELEQSDFFTLSIALLYCLSNTTGVAAFVDHSQNDTLQFWDSGGFSSRIGLHTLPYDPPRPVNVPLASREDFAII